VGAFHHDLEVVSCIHRPESLLT